MGRRTFRGIGDASGGVGRIYRSGLQSVRFRSPKQRSRSKATLRAAQRSTFRVKRLRHSRKVLVASASDGKVVRSPRAMALPRALPPLRLHRAAAVAVFPVSAINGRNWWKRWFELNGPSATLAARPSPRECGTRFDEARTDVPPRPLGTVRNFDRGQYGDATEEGWPRSPWAVSPRFLPTE
jgi:hypothetical protein